MNGSLYCTSCQVHYTLVNNKQQVSHLPLKETSQVGLQLCDKCAAASKKRRNAVGCSSFGEYFGKLSLCGRCKQQNKEFLHNFYFKNFLFYRRERRAFSFWLSCLLLFLIWEDGVSWMAAWAAFALAQYRLASLSPFEFTLLSVVLYAMGEFAFTKDLFLAVSLGQLCLAKTVFFEMPHNFSIDRSLPSFIERMSIGKGAFSWEKAR